MILFSTRSPALTSRQSLLRIDIERCFSRLPVAFDSCRKNCRRSIYESSGMFICEFSIKILQGDQPMWKADASPISSNFFDFLNTK